MLANVSVEERLETLEGGLLLSFASLPALNLLARVCRGVIAGCLMLATSTIRLLRLWPGVLVKSTGVLLVRLLAGVSSPASDPRLRCEARDWRT